MKSPLKIKYLYLKDPHNPNHRVTSVGIIKTATHFEVQIARCHAPDHFCKRIARSIISGRYRKHGAFNKYPIELFGNPQDLFEAINQDFNPVDGIKITISADAVFPLEY